MNLGKSQLICSPGIKTKIWKSVGNLCKCFPHTTAQLTFRTVREKSGTGWWIAFWWFYVSHTSKIKASWGIYKESLSPVKLGPISSLAMHSNKFG